MGSKAFILPGRHDRIRIRSATLMASDKSWVIKIAVFPVLRMMLLISSHTDNLVW